MFTLSFVSILSILSLRYQAVALWTGADDIDHTYTVACYLHFCNGGFDNIQAKDLSIRKGRDKRIVGDPLYVVTAIKRS